MYIFALHQHHKDSGHNILEVYIHFIVDALRSPSIILGLLSAMIWDLPFIDAIAAIVSSILIIKWSIGLLKDSGSSLLDIDTLHQGRNQGLGHHHYNN